MASKKSHY